MTQNMNPNRDGQKKEDPTTWTTYGDPLKNNSSHTTNEEFTKGASPMNEKSRQDGNYVKRD